MSKPTVEVSFVTYGGQPAMWWNQIMSRLLQEQDAGNVQITRTMACPVALPDFGKNAHVFAPVGPKQKLRNVRTDVNRNVVVGIDANERAAKGFFMAGKADWLLFLDTDVVPPPMFITSLLELGREFVGGVYFLGGDIDDPNDMHDPLIYIRKEDGRYAPFSDYVKGTLIEVDAIGMGCTLIHKSVFQRIMDGHTVVARPNGSLLAVPDKDMRDKKLKMLTGKEKGYVKNGAYHIPVGFLAEGDKRPWPFFAMEYGRTEDLHFCELAANVGIKPYVDTNIECEHIKMQPIRRRHHLMKEGIA